MTIFNRAWRKSKDTPMSVFFVILIFVVLTIIQLQGLFLKDISDKALEQLDETESGEVKLLAEEDGFGIGKENSIIQDSWIKQVVAEGGLSLINYSGYIRAYSQDLKVFRTSEQNQLQHEIADENYNFETAHDISLIGTNIGEYQSDFRNGTLKIIRGRGINEEDAGKYIAVISESLARNNGLEIGGTITFKINQKEEKKVTFEIIGIHTDGTGRDGTVTGSAESNSNENKVFISGETAKLLRPEGFITEVSFQVNQAAQSEKIINYIKELDPELMETVTVINKDYKYREKQNLIYAQQRYQEIVIYATYFSSIIILALFIFYISGRRRQEFGILLSMGEKKRKIIIQLLIEQLIMCIVGMLVGGCISIPLLRVVKIPDAFLEEGVYSITRQFEMEILWQTLILEMYLVIFCILIYCFLIFTKSPRKLLSRR